MDLGAWVKPTIVGRLVTLRPYAPSDVDALEEMTRDPVGVRLTGTTETFTREALEQWVGSRPTAPDRLDLVIVERATGDYAGEVVLNDYDAAANSANFRISLRGPDWFGRGLGGEATRLMVAHGFEAIGLAAITLDVWDGNERAIRAYARAGFAVTGRTEEDGRTWVDMALTRQDWQART